MAAVRRTLDNWRNIAITLKSTSRMQNARSRSRPDSRRYIRYIIGAIYFVKSKGRREPCI